MSLDDVIQLIILLLVMGGGLIAQMFQAKKRSARRAQRMGRPRGGAPPAPGGGGPMAQPPGEDEIARRVRELLERASGRKPEPPPKPVPPKVEPPPARQTLGGEVPPSTFAGKEGMDAGFQRDDKEMGGSFRVFPPSGISEGPGRGGEKRKKKPRKAPPPKPAPRKKVLPWVLEPGKKLDAASLAALLYAHPELGILGYEILGPPPAIREKPPSWEW